MLKGIDISAYQGDVDFNKVKESGVSFVYAKATEGLHEVDADFAIYHDACKHVGIPFGAYHFLHFNTDPVAQAQHFLQTTDSNHGDLLPMVDIEVTDGAHRDQLITNISLFMREVEKTLGGKKMLLYTYYGFWSDQMQGTDAFAGHPLWIAEYNNDADPALPAGFKNFTLWQHTSTAHVDGIVGDVDEDLDCSTIEAISR